MIANKAKILLVEDDASLGFVIKDNLEINGFCVTLCADGEAAWQLSGKLLLTCVFWM
jgi:DNA-binding response OmpR family regulator